MKKTEVQFRQSEIRQELSGILETAEAERTDEQRAKIKSLTAEMRRLEADLQAHLAIEVQETENRAAASGEAAGLRALEGRASLGEIVQATFEKRAAGGASAELLQHLGLPETGHLPVALLRDPHWERRAAATITGTTQTSESEVIGPVFSRGVLEYWSAYEIMRSEGGSEAVPVLTNRPSVSAGLTDSTAATATTQAFTIINVPPARYQAEVSFRRTDAVRFVGMDQSLRDAMTGAIGEQLDVAAIQAVESGVTQTDAKKKDDFASLRDRLGFGRVDGRFARSISDIRLLCPPDIYGYAAGLYQTNGEVSAIESIESVAGGVRVSPHIAAADATDKNKRNVIVRLGMARDIAVVMWNSVALIFDEYTRSSEGEIKLSAILMADVKLLRDAGFSAVEIQPQA